MADDHDSLTALNGGSLHLGPGQRILDLNDALASWRGLPRDTLRGHDLDMLLSRGSWIYWDTAVEPLLEQQGHAWDLALTLRRETRQRPPVEVLLNARRDQHGTRCLLFPYSGRRTWELRLLAAQERAKKQQDEIERLEKIETFRQEFVNAIAQELTTPLKPLRLQVHLLHEDLRTKPQPALQRRVEKIQASVDRLSWLTASIVQSADVAASRVDMNIQPIALHQVLPEIVHTWRLRSAPSRTIDVEVRDVVIEADRDALTTSLENLLDNAVKFSPSNTRIKVRARAGPPVQIIIEDKGRGIDPRRIQDLGRPFVHAHDRAHVTTLGMGLGLHIVTGLMKAQGGNLLIQSEGIGQGTTAILEFPVSEQKHGRESVSMQMTGNIR